MKKLLVVLAIVFLTYSFAEAAHLASQVYIPSEIQPTYFRLIFDGGAAIQSPAVSTTGGVWLYYDGINSLADGQHSSQLWACNGPTFPDNCSAPVVTYNFKKGLAASASPTFVTPYLNSQVYTIDQEIEPTYFIVSIDGGASVQSPAIATTGGVWMHYNINTLPDGSHSAVITTHNDWGNSVPATYNFIKGIPANPIGVRIVE